MQQIAGPSIQIPSPSGTALTLNSSFGTDTWIIDTGATDHVCKNLKMFQSYRKINPLPIKLPDGHTFLLAILVLWLLLILSI